MTESIDTSVFVSNFKGVVLKQDDEGYDERRTVWNAMVDRRPAVITCCVHTDDVVAALHFGRTNHLEIGIRGGGHCSNYLRLSQAIWLLHRIESFELDACIRRAKVPVDGTDSLVAMILPTLNLLAEILDGSDIVS